MYIDGVFSGGGAKGIALAGAYQALENHGFRFVRLAGTSAGSMVAAFIAAGYTSDEMIGLLKELDNKKILDQPYPFLPLNALRWISIYWRLGLYKGDKLENWLSEKLKEKGVTVFSLKLIASDLTNGKLMVLPDDLVSYGLNPATFSVARAIRMSCSLPYFFEPVKLRSKKGVSVVVDGGVLSNFPIWLFSEKKKRPVIGVTLTANEKERPKNSINHAFELFGALFETMKDAHDARHIATRHEQDIIFIPVNHVLATDFSLSDEKKEALVALGKKKTESFLKQWAY
jgi:NTE family protein